VSKTKSPAARLESPSLGDLHFHIELVTTVPNPVRDERRRSPYQAQTLMLKTLLAICR
jgi:hypothetical protein